ncbi:MAG: hypothetical protein U9R55_14045 [Pseudomonadota bacterium]|nr:hypothetical protein [Pseudomonadota bacterium]
MVNPFRIFRLTIGPGLLPQRRGIFCRHPRRMPALLPCFNDRNRSRACRR